MGYTLSSVVAGNPILLGPDQPGQWQPAPTIFVTLSAGADLTYNVEVTGDSRSAVSPAGNWNQLGTSSTGVTASGNWSLSLSANAVRLNITSYTSGSATLNVVPGWNLGSAGNGDNSGGGGGTEQWTAGPVGAIGSHMTLSSGTIDSLAVAGVTSIIARAPLTGGTITSTGTIAFPTIAAVSHQFITAIGTAGGTLAQPAFTDISGRETFAQMPTLASGHVIGNATTATANAGDDALTDLFDVAFSATEGSVLFRGASGWTDLAPGTSGQVLTMGTADPGWAGAGGGAFGPIVAGGGLSGGTITTSGTIALATLAAVAHQFVVSINGSGVPQLAQPAFTDVSGRETLAQMPTLGAGGHVFANVGTAAGNAADTTVSSLLDTTISSTVNSLAYRASGGWAALTPSSDFTITSGTISISDTLFALGNDKALITNASGTVTSTDRFWEAPRIWQNPDNSALTFSNTGTAGNPLVLLDRFPGVSGLDSFVDTWIEGSGTPSLTLDLQIVHSGTAAAIGGAGTLVISSGTPTARVTTTLSSPNTLLVGDSLIATVVGSAGTITAVGVTQYGVLTG